MISEWVLFEYEFIPVATWYQSKPYSKVARLPKPDCTNFPDILSTICDTRLPIPLSAFGIDLTLPYIYYWNHDSTQHRDLIYEKGNL